jgi:beta-lactamase class A
MIIYPTVNRGEEIKVSRDYGGDYKFTNPILDYEDVKMKETPFFYQSVQSKIKILEGKYGLSFSSVYYRDLNNGQWIGANEKESFTLASLTKLPVFIALLKKAETEPAIMDKMVTVKESDLVNDVEQNFKPEKAVVVGETYSIRELAERMIEESDNTAMSILVDNIKDDYRRSVFEAVGVKFIESGDDVLMRVKDYAGFFRVLFNASYLSRASSEYALGILSKTKFDTGIVSGFPNGILVAHKFGERTNYINGLLVNRQLHDCGIVYYPQKPYLLCVMTRGNNYENQEAFIKEISQYFYKELEKSLRD